MDLTISGGSALQEEPRKTNSRLAVLISKRNEEDSSVLCLLNNVKGSNEQTLFIFECVNSKTLAFIQTTINTCCLQASSLFCKSCLLLYLHK